MTNRPRWLILLCVIAACLAALQTTAAHAADVLASADGRHVFVVRPGVEETGWEILHFDVEAGPAEYRTVFRTPRRPLAIAAEGDRCVLLLAGYDATLPTPVAVSFAVAKNPLNDVWFADPPGDPTVLPPVPSGGEPAGLIALKDVFVLVHGPSQRNARGIVRAAAAADGAAIEQAPSGDAASPVGEDGAIHELDAWSKSEWVRVEPPGGFGAALELAVGRVADLGRPAAGLVWRTSDGGWRLATRVGADWSLSEIEGLSEGRPASLGLLDGRSLLAIREDGGTLRLVDLVPASPAGADGDVRLRARPFTTIAQPDASGDATVVTTATGPWLVTLDGTRVSVMTVSPIDGTVAVPVTAAEQEVAGSLVEYLLYPVILAVVLLATFLARPHIERQPSTIAEGLVPAGLLRRAAGLCVDLAPGLMLVVVVFNLDPAVFAEELRQGDPRTMLPAVVAMVVATGITVVLEVWTGRSIGKWMVGTRVAALDGSPATRWQLGLRATLRILPLLFWPISILMLLDPAGRGMPELLTRTVVLSRRPSGPSGTRIDTQG